MTSPYQTPQHFEPATPESGSPRGISWQRALSWAVGLWLLTVMLWSVLTFIGLNVFQMSLEDIIRPSSRFQISGLLMVGSVQAILYAILAARSARHPAREVALVLLIYLVLDVLTAVLFFHRSLAELADWRMLSSVGSAVLGYSLARLMVPRDFG